MLAARLVGVLVMAVGFVVLARLLTPADFGVFALVFAGFGVAHVLTEFGMREFALRKHRALPRQAVATAALVSMVMALVGATLLVGVPRLLPSDMVPPGLEVAVLPAALALFMEPMILQREVNLHRAIAFDVPAAAAIGGIVAEVATSIALAASGYGVLALAWGLFAGQAGRALILLSLSRGGPIARPGIQENGGLIRFGATLTGVRLLPKLADVLMVTALTIASGAAAAGIFNRAQRLNKLLDQTIFDGLQPVILPAFATSLRDGMDPAAMIAAKMCRLLPVIVPGFLGIILLAEPLVAVLLGPGWDAAVPALRILAFGGLAGPVTMMAVKVFTALDRVDVYGRIQLIALAATVLMAVMGATISLEAFCAGIAAGLWLKAGLIMHWHCHHVGLTEASSQLHVRAAMLATAAALLGPALLLLTGLSPLPLLMSSAVTALVGWLAVLKALRHPLWTDFGPALRGFRPSR